jgi:hypothetical protein
MPEIRDIVTIASVAVAFIGVIYSVINSKRTVYINAVTTSRIRYMDNLRDHVSRFCGLTLRLCKIEMEPKKRQKLIEEVNRLRYVIKLHLNRTKEIDLRLIDALDKISQQNHTSQSVELEKELNMIILLTQDVLSLEWSGIKEEAVKGRLGKRQKLNFDKKYLPRYLKETI